MNPDIYFEEGVIEKLIIYMNKYSEVGLVMPRVLYPNGELQYLCKLLPTPFDLLFRRFLPWRRYVEKKMKNMNFALQIIVEKWKFHRYQVALCL